MTLFIQETYKMKTYCLVCKKCTSNTNSKHVKDKGRLILKSICPVCRNKKNMFISKGSGLLDSLGLNTPQNRMKNVLWNVFK